jgi:hypothetical protein
MLETIVPRACSDQAGPGLGCVQCSTSLLSPRVTDNQYSERLYIEKLGCDNVAQHFKKNTNVAGFTSDNK